MGKPRCSKLNVSFIITTLTFVRSVQFRIIHKDLTTLRLIPANVIVFSAPACSFSVTKRQQSKTLVAVMAAKNWLMNLTTFLVMVLRQILIKRSFASRYDRSVNSLVNLRCCFFVTPV